VGCVGMPAAEQSMCNVEGPVDMFPRSNRISSLELGGAVGGSAG